MTTYYRPQAQHQTTIEVLRSRFITTVDRAVTVEEARLFIRNIREKMPDASHHVYAFRVGYGNSVTEGMSDDGEPSGTSGPPSLAVLRGSSLGDIVLVTTRYFGGTKLGTGGLVRAYTESAQAAVNSVKTELKAPKIQLGMDLPYHLYDQVKNLIETYECTLDDESFARDVSIIVTFYRSDTEQFIAELRELSSGQIDPITLAEFD